MVLDLGWLGKTKAARRPSRQRPGKLASQPSWSGAHDGVRPPSDKGSRDPLPTPHATSYHAPPARRSHLQEKKKHTSARLSTLWSGGKLIIGRSSARQRPSCTSYMSPRPSLCPSQRTTKRELATDRAQNRLGSQSRPTSLPLTGPALHTDNVLVTYSYVQAIRP